MMMQLSDQEKELIKLALNERFNSNRKVLDQLKDAGVPVQSDEVCINYSNENIELEKLFRRFIDEV